MLKLTKLYNDKKILINPFFVTVISPNNYSGVDPISGDFISVPDEGSMVCCYRQGNYAVKETVDEIEAMLKEERK